MYKVWKIGTFPQAYGDFTNIDEKHIWVFIYM